MMMKIACYERRDCTRKWMERLPYLIRSKPAFILVGVPHLAGDKGLINQFRARGFTVTPIKMNISYSGRAGKENFAFRQQ